MDKREEILVFPNITDVLFPHKVYRVYSELKSVEDTEVLRTLVGGFRELEDAKLFMEAKIKQTQKAYAIESATKKSD